MDEARSRLGSFIKDQTHSERVPPEEVDLLVSLGLDGDDAFAFMDAFATRFDVDMTGYRWYFHHGEEGQNFGGLLFPPPYRRVAHMPITVDVLLSAIRSKRWPLDYPEHKLPKVRWDIRVNQLLVVLALALVMVWLWGMMVR